MPTFSSTHQPTHTNRLVPTVGVMRDLKIHHKYTCLPLWCLFGEFVHKNGAINRGKNYEFGAGDNDSCIIMMSPPLMSSTTKNQECVCVDASTHSGKRGARGVCTFSSRTVSKGTAEQLQICLKNATSLI